MPHSKSALRASAALAPLFLLVACGGGMMGNTVSPKVVQSKAALDLSCPEVQVAQLGGTNWTATGCGKTASYVCWTSVGMGDGMCTREGAMPTP